jgi:hypothetical protein
MPWVPKDGELFPSLGWEIADWMAANLAAPDSVEYEPFEVTREQLDFLVRMYEVDPSSGVRVKHRAVLQRPRGWGKSPFLAAIACAEALAPVVFEGWDSFGQPVGQPWSALRTPLVLVTAVTEEQTANTWSPLLEMLRNGPVMDNYRLDPMDTFVALENGRIESRTSSARSAKGARAVAAIMDQTEEWVAGNGGVRFAQVLRNNATKIGGVTIESPNAFTPGEGSVAEMSALFWDQIKSGEFEKLTESRSLLYSHREAPATTDVSDRESLVAGLRVAYGDSSDHEDGCVLHEPPCLPGWAPIARIASDFYDTSNDPQVMRSDFLNQITHAADSWLSQPELRAVDASNDSLFPSFKTVSKNDAVVLGFDGSRGRSKSKPDATALVGCRVSDGHLFNLGVWEPPDGPGEVSWVLPELEVEAAVADAFRLFNVVGFYADPAMWEGRVAGWGAKYLRQLKVKASQDNPVAFNTRAISKVVQGFEALHSAVMNGEITYDGSRPLTRHFLNARRQKVRSGIVLRKPNNDYLAKIDAAYAAMLAYVCRLDALGKGVGASNGQVPRRIY